MPGLYETINDDIVHTRVCNILANTVEEDMANSEISAGKALRQKMEAVEKRVMEILKKRGQIGVRD